MEKQQTSRRDGLSASLLVHSGSCSGRLLVAVDAEPQLPLNVALHVFSGVAASGNDAG